MGSENPSAKIELETEERLRAEDWVSYASRRDQGTPIEYFQSKGFQEVYVGGLRI